jgi:Spy/CpxP family protein refolding chaperone
MNIRNHVLKVIPAAVAGCLFLLTNVTYADAPLKSALGLSIDQAAQVDEIEKQTREAIRPVRTELHREERALRRAQIANDSEAITRQEKLIEPLRKKMSALHESETQRVRAILTPEQNVKYDAHLKTRDEMVGSSRDVKEYQEKPARANP